MGLKQIISKFFWSPISSKEKVEKYQKIIRDKEWGEIKKYNDALMYIELPKGENKVTFKFEAYFLKYILYINMFLIFCGICFMIKFNRKKK